jgi:hypothetical protein
VKKEKIRELNDTFRKYGRGNGQFIVTLGVRNLPPPELLELTYRLRNFDNFKKGNDPYGEHDFGTIQQRGVKYFWKIDYYDLNLGCRNGDESDEEKTVRVLTLMRADEY